MLNLAGTYRQSPNSHVTRASPHSMSFFLSEKRPLEAEMKDKSRKRPETVERGITADLLCALGATKPQSSYPNLWVVSISLHAVGA